MRSLLNLFHFISCPYQDKDCPKISELKGRDNGQDTQIRNIQRILYIIVGMVAVNWGFSLW